MEQLNKITISQSLGEAGGVKMSNPEPKIRKQSSALEQERNRAESRINGHVSEVFNTSQHMSLITSVNFNTLSDAQKRPALKSGGGFLIL